MSPITSFAPQKDTKSARIAASLEEMILSKKFVAGEELPSQRDLIDRFGASSRSIREALKQLEAKGLISVSQGKRAKVKSNNLDQFVESLSTTIIKNHSSNKKLILDLVQVRTTLCVSAAREYSRMPDRQTTCKDLKRITGTMIATLPDIMARDNSAFEKFMDLEAQFHRVLIKSNNNPILNAIYDNLVPLLETNIRSFKYSYHELEKRTREYGFICEALQNGQTDLVVALVLVTLSPVRQKIEEKFLLESSNKTAI